VKKSKLDPLDFNRWGVKNYGYELWINPASEFVFDLTDPCVIDVENYKDGRFAGLGILPVGEKTILYYTDLEAAKKHMMLRGMLIGHVLRTDIHKLVRWGFDIVVNRTHYDTALVEHLTNSTKKRYGLKELAKEKFCIEYPSYDTVIGKGDFDAVPVEVAANYNGMDLVATAKLYESQEHSFISSRLYKDLLWPLGYVLNDMEERGIALDLDHLRKLGAEFSAQLADISKEIKNALGDINLNSPKQLLEALHVKGIAPKYRGKASVDKRGLRSLEQTPLISQLLGLSELETLLSSFVTPLLEQDGPAKTRGGAVHAFFSQTGTRTGRLACYRPNLQQIPTHTENGRAVKMAYVPRPGFKFVELDYAAIEPRLLAHFSKAKALTELFKSGINFHDFTAQRLVIDRQAAKVLNLSTGYRATKYGIAYQLKCSVEDAERQLNDWWGLWPDLYLWESNLIAETRRLGYVTTLLGRKIYIDDLDHEDKKKREAAERRVIENTAQSSVSEIIGLAMIELYKSGLYIVNQIHDAVLLEVEEDFIEPSIKKATEIMESVLKLNVPIPVEAKVGDSWGAMEKVSKCAAS
jgi:DNA polymerase-1